MEQGDGAESGKEGQLKLLSTAQALSGESPWATLDVAADAGLFPSQLHDFSKSTCLTRSGCHDLPAIRTSS